MHTEFFRSVNAETFTLPLHLLTEFEIQVYFGDGDNFLAVMIHHFHPLFCPIKPDLICINFFPQKFVLYSFASRSQVSHL